VVWAPAILFGCLLAGFLSGCLSALLTQMVYFFEDMFLHLKRIHWMWWPAIGGLGIGVGGFFYPRALGVGYDVIQQLLQGNATVKMILGVLLVKCFIWSFSLGSGTSGGVLAPLLMMGGALGAVDALFLPHQGAGFWPLISMGAMLAGTMRSPLTGVIFAFELTGDYHSILPLLIACVAAHTFTVLTMSRSILTEKISRRGHHLSREYVVDPMEALAVEDVMRTNITAFPAETTIAELQSVVERDDNSRGQRAYPVINADRQLLGVMTRHDLVKVIGDLRKGEVRNVRLSEMIAQPPIVAYPNEPLRLVVNRMAASGVTLLPVIKQNDGQELLGLIGLPDLLKAREFSILEEQHRERVLRLRVPLSLRWRGLGINRNVPEQTEMSEPTAEQETGVKDR
jgi:CBS domain-containing protein